MELEGVEIIDTYAEAFSSYAARILVTAKDMYWARQAAQSAIGFATSTIHCPCEAGIDKEVPPEETPDGRPGIILMFFADKKKMNSVLLDRIGQCILTCPSTAAFDAYPAELVNEEKTKKYVAGKNLSFFGDGYQEKDDKTYSFITYKIPVMDGEFVVQSSFKYGKHIAGGNLIIQAENLESCLEAAKNAVAAASKVDWVIMPFPGGVVRSGSKVGSKYDFLSASTNDALCPSLKDKVKESQVKEGANAVLEIVYDGLTHEAISKAMSESIKAAVKVPGVIAIGAGNYDGKLGKHKFYLKDLI
ncbi:MAG: formylmethanofuran--tetrahydromethanopterin N-formyltransferase [Promethearchaeota archaeon]